jgi:D-ribose pyranase
MKKGELLNSEISYVISKLGHKDEIIVADAGLPIPENVQRIDLAVTKNFPGFIPVFEAILTEQKIEAVIMAEEIEEASPGIHNEILEILKRIEKENEADIKVFYIPHEAFKASIANCKAVIRTGEFTPYANIGLISGVVF